MFTLKEDITFSQVCEIDIPLPGGGFETSKLKCEFKLIDKATTEAAFEADENGGDLLEQAFIRPLDPIGQEGVDGAIEFTEQVRAKFLNNPCVRAGLMRGYLRGVAGRKRKN